MIDLFQGTGRTTRMLDRAARLASTGRHVAVGCASAQHGYALVRQFFELAGDSYSTARLSDLAVAVGAGKVTFLPWFTNVFDGLDPSVIRMYDHFAAHSWPVRAPRSRVRHRVY